MADDVTPSATYVERAGSTASQGALDAGDLELAGGDLAYGFAAPACAGEPRRWLWSIRPKIGTALFFGWAWVQHGFAAREYADPSMSKQKVRDALAEFSDYGAIDGQGQLSLDPP